MKRLLTTILSVVFCIAVSAQGACVINGSIADVKAADGKKVKKVYLTRTNELGQDETVAEAKVKKGKFAFKRELAKDEPVLMYTIKGLPQDVEVFVEPGEVAVNTASAANPCATTVAGTPTNDTYSEYKKMVGECSDAALKSADESTKSKEAIRCLSQIIRFLIDHNASPMTPLEIERYLLQQLSPAYAEQMLKSVSTTLESHPYYLSLRNKVLANDLKVGNEAPDITLPLLSGDKKQLNDFRGKYILLNFWASGDEKSAEMLAELKNVYNVIKDNDEYIIVSFALESDAAAWKAAVESCGINLEGWMNACDGVGAESPAAKLFGVEKTPRIILIEPEGRAVSLDMEIDEVLMRIEQIMEGDLYYLDQEE